MTARNAEGPDTETPSERAVTKTSVVLADGRELIYFDASDTPVRDRPDRRTLDPREPASQVRHDPILDEWVIVAGHRQSRTHLPPDDQCPLCPSTADRRTEIPAPSYEVAVFENRFPSLSGVGEPSEAAGPGDGPREPPPGTPLRARPGVGRCEVVCFSQEHDGSFADLSPRQAVTVLAAWTDRTAELSALPGVEQVFCFENRGPEIGVTLSHPHGQVYAYPFVTPRTSRMLATAAAHRERTGRNLFDDVLAAERADGGRIVSSGEHWTAFVPHAARWPYEVHLYPNRRVPDLGGLTDEARTEFCHLYLDLLRRFDHLFDTPAPYIAAWHQAPVRSGGDEFALHLELFTTRRASGKLKHLAGSESGMDVFANDVAPEDAARRLNDLA